MYIADLSLTDYKTINEQNDTLQTIRMYTNTEPSTNENEAYGKVTEETHIADYDYAINPVALMYDPSTTQNLAYSDVATAEYSVIAITSSRGWIE